MNEERREKLTEIVSKLEALKGVKLVESDDFDGTSVNVFIKLEVTSYIGSDMRPMVFSSGIPSIKSSVTQVCRESDIGMTYLDWPHMRYKTIFREKYKYGYDCDYLKISLYI